MLRCCEAHCHARPGIVPSKEMHLFPPQGCRIGHLDRPYGAWPRSVTDVPAAAMGLEARGVGSLRAGGPADFVLFRGRRFSELLARPQFDRVRTPCPLPPLPLACSFRLSFDVTRRTAWQLSCIRVIRRSPGRLPRHIKSCLWAARAARVVDHRPDR